MIDLNSMLYWWPKVARLDVPKPKTLIVDIREVVDEVFECYYLDNSNSETCKQVREKISVLASFLDNAVNNQFSGYPVFMRSDYTACRWFKSRRPLYRIESVVDFKSNIMPLITDCHIPASVPSSIGPPKPNALVVREWLDIVKWTEALDRPYSNVEVRVIAGSGYVVDVFPYYYITLLRELVHRLSKNPEQVFIDYSERYESLVESGFDEIVEYTREIMKIPGIGEHEWILDFALVDYRGTRKWVFIDMSLFNGSRKLGKNKELREHTIAVVPFVG